MLSGWVSKVKISQFHKISNKQLLANTKRSSELHLAGIKSFSFNLPSVGSPLTLSLILSRQFPLSLSGAAIFAAISSTFKGFVKSLPANSVNTVISSCCFGT